MTTSSTSNDLKKAAGYFKEKLAIGLSRVSSDELSRAILKVTSHKLKAPNEKHMARLIEATYGRVSDKAAQQHELLSQFIVEELELRSHMHNWVTVLKTMVTFHRLMQEGSADINAIIQRNGRRLFSSHSIKDVGDSVGGVAQQRFIEQYMRYLEERCAAQLRLGLQVRLESAEFVAALSLQNFKTLSESAPLLMAQLECGASVTYRDDVADNFLTLDAYVKLTQDCKRLHVALMDRVLSVLKNFVSLEVTTKRVWLELLERYFAVVSLVKGFFETMANSRRHFGIDFPRVTPFPPELLKELRDEVEYASVPLESLDALPPTDTEAPPEAPPAPSAAPPSDAPPPAQETPPAAPSPPPSRNDIDDLFGGAAPPSAAEPPARQESRDLFAADTWQPSKPPAFTPSWHGGPVQDPLTAPAAAAPPPAAMPPLFDEPPVATAPPMAATPPVASAPATFDPFADPDPPPQGGNIVDFFSSSSSQQPAKSAPSAPRVDGRAW